MVFLVLEVSSLAKILTAFLIIASLIYGYMLIASTDSIVDYYLFIFTSLSIYFRSDAWPMEMCEYFSFTLSKYLLLPRYPILENVVVKFFAGITNLVGNPPFLLIVF